MKTRSIILRDHELQALAGGRLGLIARVVRPQLDEVDVEPQYQNSTWAFWNGSVLQYYNGREALFCITGAFYETPLRNRR